jgi:predicted signal transduction protein with EAL and GGDEF domain
MGGVKRSGRDGQVSQSQKRTHQEKRERCLAVCTNVQNALRQRRLLFAFQPVVCATTGEVDYFECLLRMRDVEGSIVTGRHFITSIEQLGLYPYQAKAGCAPSAGKRRTRLPPPGRVPALS